MMEESWQKTSVISFAPFFPPRLLLLVNLENKERQLLKSGATGSVQAPQQLNKFSDF